MAERRTEHLMGTVFSFDIRDDTVPAGLLDEVVHWLHTVDATFSTYSADSAISRLDRGEVRLRACPADVAEVLDLCAAVEQETNGYFSARWNGHLDPTGLVKGWSVERASRMLRAGGVRAHAVGGGGDVRTAGAPAPGEQWQIGVAHPFRRRECVTVLAGNDLAVATSGLGERGAHILNPFTRRPVTTLTGVTVAGPDLTFADAYATAAIAMGPAGLDWLAECPSYEAFVVYADGRTAATPGYAAFAQANNANNARSSTMADR